MKNDLTCGVVRDLLPSYVEGLLGEESREAVDRHLEDCPECTAKRDAMTAPPGEAEEAAKEVDYLKRVKKGTAKKIALAVVCTALVLAAGLLLKEFVIGYSMEPESVSIQLAEVDEGGSLTFLADTYKGAYELRGVKSTEKDGVVLYTAREVRVNLFQGLFMQETRGGMTGYWKQIPLSVPLKGVSEVWFCGRLVWKDGVVISRECLELLDLRTPYCGDAAALGRVAQALNLQDRLGGYTTELQTSQRPYRWTLVLQNYFAGDEDSSQWNYAVRCEYLMLALVDNLDSVRLEDTGGKQGQEMTLDKANQYLEEIFDAYNHAHGTSWEAKASVKDCTHGPADFQRLLEALDFYYLEGGRDLYKD